MVKVQITCFHCIVCWLADLQLAAVVVKHNRTYVLIVNQRPFHKSTVSLNISGNYLRGLYVRNTDIAIFHTWALHCQLPGISSNTLNKIDVVFFLVIFKALYAVAVQPQICAWQSHVLAYDGIWQRDACCPHKLQNSSWGQHFWWNHSMSAKVKASYDVTCS